MISSLLTLAHGVAVLCPGFVPFLPAPRLTNPLLFVRLIGGEMQLFLGAFNRVRPVSWCTETSSVGICRHTLVELSRSCTMEPDGAWTMALPSTAVSAQCHTR